MLPRDTSLPYGLVLHETLQQTHGKRLSKQPTGLTCRYAYFNLNQALRVLYMCAFFLHWLHQGLDPVTTIRGAVNEVVRTKAFMQALCKICREHPLVNVKNEDIHRTLRSRCLLPAKLMLAAGREIDSHATVPRRPHPLQGRGAEASVLPHSSEEDPLEMPSYRACGICTSSSGEGCAGKKAGQFPVFEDCIAWLETFWQAPNMW